MYGKLLTSSTSQTNKNTCIGVMNIMGRGTSKMIRKKCLSSGAGSVHDSERRAVYTHVPNLCMNRSILDTRLPL